MGTHRDGQFVTFALEHKIQHYKIENQSASLIYEDFTTYNSVLYSETEPNLIYLSRSDIPLIELRNAIDFSLISTINLDNIVVIRNIDPISGYMLLRRIGFLHILDLQTQNLILTVDSQDTRPKLYDSKVFLESGYCVDFKPSCHEKLSIDYFRIIGISTSCTRQLLYAIRQDMVNIL